MSVPASHITEPLTNADESRPIVIVGTGPVGIRVLHALLRQRPQQPAIIYGGEPWQPYNRVRLSSFLAGDIRWDDLVSTQYIQDQPNVLARHNCRIVRIEREAHCVIDEHGTRQPYAKLILATGSRPHIPKIPGHQLQRVYTFRDLKDTQELVARRVQSRCTVVVGGGLLGLEAARAMSRHNTQVIVVDHAMRLMPQQLDEQAAELLKEQVLALGIRILLGSGIRQIEGEDSVTAIHLQDGRRIACDTLIFATGIVPNIELARAAHLSVGRGIRVDDTMQTSDPDIYAVGECAEHRDRVYGIVAPGYEQAEVAAHTLTGKTAHYAGSIAATRLKVIGVPVFSMGPVGDEEHPREFNFYQYANPARQCYRKLVLRRGRLVGVIAVGAWDSEQRVQEAITAGRIVWPWQLRRFMMRGELWPAQAAADVADWPAQAIVCQCMHVTRGQCTQAIRAGCNSIDRLMASTHASTVCGSCRPLLGQLLGARVRLEALRARKSFFVLAMLTLVLTTIAFVTPGLPYNTSSMDALRWDVLWRDATLKQVTGYSVLGASLIGLAMSMRKRWKKVTWLQFDVWRYAHVALGVFAVLMLIFHTGFRPGNNLNFWLMSLFVGLLFAGGASAVLMSVQHRLDAARAKQLRAKLLWVHLLLFWPVPALLAAHITKTYYF